VKVEKADDAAAAASVPVFPPGLTEADCFLHKRKVRFVHFFKMVCLTWTFFVCAVLQSQREREEDSREAGFFNRFVSFLLIIRSFNDFRKRRLTKWRLRRCLPTLD
jgi:hypothetical protein